MKRLCFTAILCSLLTPVFAQDAKPKPEDLTMTLAWIADAGEPKQYVFVINGVVAYKTMDGLKKYLKDIPKGSSLTWAQVVAGSETNRSLYNSPVALFSTTLS